MEKIAGFGILLGMAGALCAMVVPIAVLGGIGLYVFQRHRRRSAALQAAQAWPSTMGVVVTSTIQIQRTVRSRSEVPVIVYQYQVDGASYLGKVIKAGDQYFSVRFAGDARKTVERYPVGAEVTVFYNPADPADAAVER